MLSEQEKYRYDRHLKLELIGEEGQLKLKNAKVLVVGSGGLGCPALQYLTAAGVGYLGIIDGDKLERSNLQRQILFREEDIGKNKAIAARAQLSQLNSEIEIEALPYHLSTKNALNLIPNYDVVLDGTDNFATRYLINDACVILDKPFVYGGIFKFQGQYTVFNYNNGPTYRCLFPDPPTATDVPNCSQVGVLGVLPGLIGIHQATEVIKIVTGIGEVASGVLHIVNALNGEHQRLIVESNEEQKSYPKKIAPDFQNQDYAAYCGELSSETQIAAEDLDRYINNDKCMLLDVREEWEDPKLLAENLLNIPLSELEDRLSEIPRDKQLVVFCQSGIRSQEAISQLSSIHNFSNLVNLKGGISAYERKKA